MRWRLGLRPRPRWGAYEAPPNPLVRMGVAPSALATRYILAPHILLAQIYPPNSTFLESPIVLSNPQTPPPRKIVSFPDLRDLNYLGPLTYFLVIRPLRTYTIERRLLR